MVVLYQLVEKYLGFKLIHLLKQKELKLICFSFEQFGLLVILKLFDEQSLHVLYFT